MLPKKRWKKCDKKKQQQKKGAQKSKCYQQKNVKQKQNQTAQKNKNTKNKRHTKKQNTPNHSECACNKDKSIQSTYQNKKKTTKAVVLNLYSWRLQQLILMLKAALERSYCKRRKSRFKNHKLHHQLIIKSCNQWKPKSTRQLSWLTCGSTQAQRLTEM